MTLQSCQTFPGNKSSYAPMGELVLPTNRGNVEKYCGNIEKYWNIFFNVIEFYGAKWDKNVFQYVSILSQYCIHKMVPFFCWKHVGKYFHVFCSWIAEKLTIVFNIEIILKHIITICLSYYLMYFQYVYNIGTIFLYWNPRSIHSFTILVDWNKYFFILWTYVLHIAMMDTILQQYWNNIFYYWNLGEFAAVQFTILKKYGYNMMLIFFIHLTICLQYVFEILRLAV